jgi:hypothetical protein
VKHKNTNAYKTLITKLVSKSSNIYSNDHFFVVVLQVTQFTHLELKAVENSLVVIQLLVQASLVTYPSISHSELVAVEAVTHHQRNSCVMLCTVLCSCTGGSCSAPNIEKIHCNLCIACQLFLWRFDTQQQIDHLLFRLATLQMNHLRL